MMKTEIIEELDQLEREFELQRLMQMVEEFDFETALKLSNYLYYIGEHTVDELKETLRGLVLSLFNNPDTSWTSTGRFTVIRDINGEIKFFFGISNR